MEFKIGDRVRCTGYQGGAVHSGSPGSGWKLGREFIIKSINQCLWADDGSNGVYPEWVVLVTKPQPQPQNFVNLLAKIESLEKAIKRY